LFLVFIFVFFFFFLFLFFFFVFFFFFFFFFADEADPHDSFIPLRDMFGTCLSVVAALTKDCIEEFHLVVKSLNQRKLIHTKLSFSLDQIISISKLALESKYAEDCEARNSICVGALQYCIRCIQTLLSDSNMQVNYYVRNITPYDYGSYPEINSNDRTFFLIGSSNRIAISEIQDSKS